MEEPIKELLLLSGGIFGAVFVIVACIAAWDYWRWCDATTNERYLNKVYQSIWNGKESDRIYAWFRVKQHLKQWNKDPDLINMAEARYQQEKQIHSSTLAVDETGQLNERNNNSSDMEEV